MFNQTALLLQQVQLSDFDALVWVYNSRGNHWKFLVNAK